MKTAIITGGTSGIGLATAKIFLAENYNCALVGRHLSKFEKIKDELKGNFEFIEGNVGRFYDCRKIVSKTLEIFGGVDVLINCAGIYGEGAITKTTEKEYDEIFNTNVKGTFFMSREVVHEITMRRGCIVNVASDAGVRGNYFCAAYSASKGAVIAFTKSLALELASLNVRVNCVAPGDILTPLTLNQLKNSGETVSDLSTLYPVGRIGKPEEVAEAIYFLASEKSSFITGAILNVDGGITA